MTPQRALASPAPTPYEAVRELLPFRLYTFQEQAVNTLAVCQNAGLYLDVGTGKTATSTALALYKLKQTHQQVIVLMPPILITGWGRWLAQVKGTTHLAYRGSPAERSAMRLDKLFLLMSYQIFKRDFERLQRELGHKALVIIADEATALKSAVSDNHRKFCEFSAGHDVMLLTGTPITTPADGYAYCKIVAPGTYRSLAHFENMHVKERDFFKKVSAWMNLDVLAHNMRINAVRILKEDVLLELPKVIHTPMFYDLHPEHQRLYTRLVDEQLLRLPDGGKIDATQITALMHACGQIVLNWGHFSGYAEKIAAGIELIEELLQELGEGKLVVFSNYRMTNQLLHAHFKSSVAVFGDISREKQNKALDKFIDDKACRLIFMQPRSAGYGINGLQHVCSNVLFMEPPITSTDFQQCLARLHRDGQRLPVNARMAIAEKTIQVRQFDALLRKDDLVGAVIRNPARLRDVFFGGGGS